MTDVPDTPDTIYHYCGVSGFHGILESKTLWMNDAYSMNDYTEHRLILDPAVQQLDTLSREPANSRFCAKLKKSLLDLSALHPYVCCFSSKPDLLSQWRAYSDDGAGFAIGFSGDGIDTRWTSRMDRLITLREVEYDPCKQKTRLREVIEKCLARYLKRFPDGDTADGYEGLEIATAHADLWDLATVCKHHGFREEKEWRLVRMPRASDLAAPGSPIANVGVSEMCFRVSGDGKRPYFAFAFHVEDVVEIRLGPKNQEGRSLEAFLRENGYDVDRIGIFKSAVPYH